MFPRFQKTMLKVGTYHSPDGKVRVTPQRLKHWEREFRRLSRNRQTVPMHWDHGDDLENLAPVPSGRSAANSVGKMVDFKVKPGARAAEIRFETHDDRATSKVKTNSVYVSPVIFPRWKDGGGNQYTDLITHLDLVDHPVDHSQGPAIPVGNAPIACALRMGLKVKPLRLAIEDDMDEEEKLEDEEQLLEDSDGDGTFEGELEGVTDGPDDELDGDFVGDDMADDEPGTFDLDADDFDTEEPAGEDMTGLAADDEAEPVVDDIAGAGPGTGDLMLVLAEHGIVLPYDTTEVNFMDRLRTALIATKDDAQGSGGSPYDSGETIVADPQVAMMSSVTKFAEKANKKRLAMSLKRLLKSGRCSPAEYRQKKAGLKAVKLSLRPDGRQRKTPLDAWIRSRAVLPAGAVWSSKEKLRRLSSVPAPTETKLQGGQITGDELDAAVREFLKK